METSKIDASAMDPSGDAGMSFASRLWRILTLGDRLARRNAVVVWADAAIGLGLFAGWNWVVAAGLSSTVLALLPCAAMCALGLCAGSSGKKCSDKAAPGAPPDTSP